MKTPREPATEFDWAAVEPTGADDDAGGRAHGRLVFDAVLSMLLDSTISGKKLAARALALGVVSGFHTVRGKSLRELARLIGINHTLLNRSVAEVRAEVRAVQGKECSKRRLCTERPNVPTSAKVKMKSNPRSRQCSRL